MSIGLHNGITCRAYGAFFSERSQFKSRSLQNKSAKWHCGRHTLICKKILIKKT